MELSEYILGGAAAIGLGIAYTFGEIAYGAYREKHPKIPRGGFIDPRLDFEKFMNGCGYNRRIDYCPYPNPNPDTMLGRFATRNMYFKLRERK